MTTKFARILDGVATDVFVGDLEERFHPSLAAEFVPVPETVEEGWTLAAGAWSAPVRVPLPPLRTGPVRLPKIDFLRLFTAEETIAFNLLRKRVQALTPENYGSADAATRALVGFEVFLGRYDALADQIELDHPETLQGLDLLVALNVLTPARRAEVAAGRAAPALA